MERLLRRGYWIIVSPKLPVAGGELGYGQVVTGEQLIEVVHKHTNGYLPTSYKPAYPPRSVAESEVGQIHRVAYVRTLKRERKQCRPATTADALQIHKAAYASVLRNEQ